MILRRFNPAGIDRFRLFVRSLREDKTRPAPLELLEDDLLTEVIQPLTEVPDATFANRLEAARYLDNLLTHAGLESALSDIGLWSWLSLRFFDQVRPLGDKLKALGGNVKQLGVNEARFIPTPLDDYETYYRHLLRHPLQIYRHVGRDADVALCFLLQPVHQPGDIVEQLASRVTYIRNKDIMAAITALFVEASSLSIKRNASTKARRLHYVFEQFDCTWDLGYVAKALLIPMLPKEFDKFKAA